jgi:hypothetical protein
MTRSHRTVALAVTAAGCAVAFSLQGTQAAFTATTSSVGSFGAGTVAISDDDTGQNLFTVSNLAPGSTGSRCIAVTYTGSVANQVKLYVGPVVESNGGGGDVVNAVLDDHLTISVDYDTTSSVGWPTGTGCAGFVTAGNLYSGTLRAMATAHNDFSNGRQLSLASGAIAPWNPATSEKRIFRFTYTLNSNAPDTAQGDSVTATFNWEAQST